MSKWETIEASVYCDKVADGTHDSPKPQQDGEFLITSKHITGGKIDLEKAYKITKYDFDKVNTRSQVHRWDVLITMIGTVGEICIVKDEPNFAIKNIGLFKCNGDEQKAKWLYNYLRSKEGQSEIKGRLAGTTQEYITLADLRKLPVPITDKKEMESINITLSSLDDKIDLLHRQNKTLEQLAETLFRQWFIEEAEESWEEVVLGNFIKVKHGFAFKGKYISSEPTNLILVTPGNFKIGGGFKSDKFKYYTSEEFPSDYIFQDGDLAVTMTDLSVKGDTLGYPALTPERIGNELYLHNQRVGKVEIIKEISKFFIYFLMKTKDYQWFVLGGASGTSIRHTSPTSICSYSFYLPSPQKLMDFEHLSNDLFAKIKSNTNQIRTLTQLRDTLLPKLMSGEVRVV